MYQLDEISENKIINDLIVGLKRSPDQLNRPHESDAEIVQINNVKLAFTTDSISEEISTGLYDDPYMIGWMIVTVNISDLAAVGASPIGILISEIIPQDFGTKKLQQLQKGISDACNKYNTYVLGGDTNEGENLVLTGTAIGRIDGERYLTRIGCKSGDILYSSGKLGSGNAYAVSKLISPRDSFVNYKPVAKIEASEVVKNYATACMDTSDGFISTLDQLMRLNEVGFELSEGSEKLIDEDSLNYSKKLNVPPWLLFAGQHGEFELIFTVPNNLNRQFLKHAETIGLNPIKIGMVTPDKNIKMSIYDEIISIDTAFIRNLPYLVKGNTKLYLEKLLEYDNNLKREHTYNFTTG